MTSISLKALVLAAGVAATLGFAHSAKAAYTAKIDGPTLALTGNGASDKLALRLGSPTILQVDVGDDGTADFAFDRSSFTGVTVNAGGGNDQIRIDQSGGTFTDESIVMNGEGGNDTLLGGNGADFMIGGPGNDFADGNIGADVALLGDGNDTFHWDPGDGSDIVEGQDGKDLLDFAGANVSERIDVSANGGRVRFVRDIGSIVMDLNDVEAIDFHALGGTDSVVVNDLAGTDVKTVETELNADGAADTVTARGTDGDDAIEVDGSTVSGLAAETVVTGGEQANDVLRVDGAGGNDNVHYEGTAAADTIQVAAGATDPRTTSGSRLPVDTTSEHLTVEGRGGADTISASGNLAPLTSLVLDGGNGADTLRGGNGNDILLGGNGNDDVDGNQGSDTAFLGSGADRFEWDPGDGSDTIEGQAGKDLLDFFGANIAEKVEVSANGGRVRFTRDIANIVMDTDDVERIGFRALGGIDSVTVNDLAGTDVDSVELDLGTDGSADSVTVNGTSAPDAVKVSRDGSQVRVAGLAAETRIAGSEAANDLLRIQTLAGDDSVAIGPDVSELIGLLVDLGTDE